MILFTHCLLHNLRTDWLCLNCGRGKDYVKKKRLRPSLLTNIDTGHIAYREILFGLFKQLNSFFQSLKTKNRYQQVTQTTADIVWVFFSVTKKLSSAVFCYQILFAMYYKSNKFSRFSHRDMMS